MKDQKFYNDSMKRFYEENGNKFPACSSLGGYELQYITSHPSIICSNCANKEDMIEDVTETYIFWEGEDQYCDECNKPITSEYGNPFADEEGNGNE